MIIEIEGLVVNELKDAVRINLELLKDVDGLACEPDWDLLYGLRKVIEYYASNSDDSREYQAKLNADIAAAEAIFQC